MALKQHETHNAPPDQAQRGAHRACRRHDARRGRLLAGEVALPLLGCRLPDLPWRPRPGRAAAQLALDGERGLELAPRRCSATARLMRPTALDAACGGQNFRRTPRILSMNSCVFAASQHVVDDAELERLLEASTRHVTLHHELDGLALDCDKPPGAACRPCREHAQVHSGRPILPAPLRAMRMSAAMAISRPPPTVWPLRRRDDELGRLLETVERLVGVQAEVVL